MKNWLTLFLRPRFFQFLGIWLGLVALSYFLPPVFLSTLSFLGLLYLVLVLVDAGLLYLKRKPVEARREMAAVLSLGSENLVRLVVRNRADMRFSADIIDELPAELQIRNFRLEGLLPAGAETEFPYHLRPLSRGQYQFGDIRVFIRTRLGLAERCILIPAAAQVAVYPSVIEMRKHQLMASLRISVNQGMRKIRRIGHSYDFDHIKDYARGDDPRSINWKATGKLNRVMVNHYEDQKSQQVFSILDLGRNMSSPFDQMSLLDYSINATLVLSRIILQKEDKAGLLAFGDREHTFIPAERGNAQLGRIMQSLYNLKEAEGDASLERIYQLVRSHIRIRSLLVYFTNIESLTQLERLLPMLERIKARHLLVVVLFENAEVVNYTRETHLDLDEIYAQTVARKYIFEKQQIAIRLRRSGIYTILTQPQQLTVQAINQYLELKARGLI